MPGVVHPLGDRPPTGAAGGDHEPHGAGGSLCSGELFGGGCACGGDVSRMEWGLDLLV